MTKIIRYTIAFLMVFLLMIALIISIILSIPFKFLFKKDLYNIIGDYGLLKIQNVIKF